MQFIHIPIFCIRYCQILYDRSNIPQSVSEMDVPFCKNTCDDHNSGDIYPRASLRRAILGMFKTSEVASLRILSWEGSRRCKDANSCRRTYMFLRKETVSTSGLSCSGKEC